MPEQHVVNPKDGGTANVQHAADLIDRMASEEEEAEETQDAAPEEEQPDAELEAGADDEEGSEEADEDEEGPLTLDAIAQHLERDDLDDVELTIRADGQDHTLTLAELKKGYQRDANYRRQTTELAQQRKALESDFQERINALDGYFQVNGAAIQRAKQRLMAQLDSPEMQQLRTSNPSEWNARQLDAQRLARDLDQEYQQLAAMYAQHRNQIQEREQHELKEFAEREGQRLMEVLPDWSPEMNAELTRYLMAEGYQPDELSGTVDSRHIVTAWKAWQYDKLKRAEGKTKKKLSKLPKSVAPAKQKSAGSERRKQRRNADIDHRKKKSVDSAAAALAARGY